MIAIRLTYNGNVDWVYPFPPSFLQSWHSLGGVKVDNGHADPICKLTDRAIVW